MALVEGLLEKLRKIDESPYERSLAVRFVLLRTFSGLRSLDKELREKGYKTFYLENFIREGKNWLSIEDLKRIVEDLLKEAGYSFLFSACNLLRFYSDDELKKLLYSFERYRPPFEITDRKVVLVLSGIGQRVKRFIGDNPLVVELPEEENHRVQLYVLNPQLEINVELLNFKQLLELWKKKIEKAFIKLDYIYKRSKNAYPDDAVVVEKIDSYKEFLEKVYGIYDELFKEEEVCEFIVKELQREEKSNIEELSIVKSLGNQKDLLLITFLKEPTKSKRVFYLYLLKKLFDFPKSLLSEDPIELLESIYRLGEIELLKKILIEIPSYEEELCKKINGQFIRGLLDCEKRHLLISYAEGKIEEDELLKVEDFCNYLYDPYDLTDIPFDWLRRYFTLYKRAKLKDIKDEELEKLLEENSSEDKFYSWYAYFRSPKEALENLRSEADEIYWIDALGFEWAGFTVKYFLQKGLNVIRFEVLKAQLPSITEENRLENCQYIRDFDMLLHQTYEYPESFLEQIRKLKDIFKSIYSPNKRILIISDHGSTFLSRLYEPLKYEVQALHSGRYTKDFIDTPHVLKKEEYFIAKFHSSLKHKPYSEVHGGATPEEVLTFALLFAPYGAEKRVKVKLENKKVPRIGELVLSFYPIVPKGLTIYIDRKPVKFETKGDKVIVNLKEVKLRTGKHILKVTGEGIDESIDFEVVGGLLEDELF
jgi:hypothetical protein